jgi:hypothetical protein
MKTVPTIFLYPKNHAILKSNSRNYYIILYIYVTIYIQFFFFNHLQINISVIYPIINNLSEPTKHIIFDMPCVHHFRFFL